MSRLERLKHLPVLSVLLRKRYERRFATARGMNLFRGAFPGFQEALASVPQTKPVGYDIPETAGMYDDRLTKVFASDYPPMFWLKGILAPGMRVFDFGGHVGIAYHAYSRYFPFPEGLTWTVCDVPSVTKAGEAMAAERGLAGGLRFANDWRSVTGADVLVSFGALQYLEAPVLEEMLATWTEKPKHVVLNKLPVHETRTFVTLQNMSAAFCPYRIFRRKDLIAAVEALGYELVDSWTCEESAYIPYPKGASVARYSGFYFRRKV